MDVMVKIYSHYKCLRCKHKKLVSNVMSHCYRFECSNGFTVRETGFCKGFEDDMSEKIQNKG